MQLLRIVGKGFRSLRDFEIDFASLTVLIGENDAGKSSVLDLLDIVLNGKRPDENDFYSDARGSVASVIEVILEFDVKDGDIDALQYSLDNRLIVRKIYRRDSLDIDTFYRGEQPTDVRLQQFHNLKSQEQKEVIQELDPSIQPNEISNAEKRQEWLVGYLRVAPKEESWIPVPSRWGNFLPRFERYSSMDYKEPANMVAKTLRQVYEQFIYEEVSDEEGNSYRRLIQPLREVESSAKQEIQTKISELEEYIVRYNPKARKIGYEPIFDFDSSLRVGEFTIDLGLGLHRLSKTGDGTKRRMFMAVLDWDREVLLQQDTEKGDVRSIIRGYDEPDTNLHYDAQRLMFQAISDVAENNDHIQAILCTHSLTMIDRAMAQSVRLLKLDENGQTCVEKIQTDNDPEIEKFLINVARELGVTNSVIFYERCFIIVEGETEANSLPLLYKKIYGRSLFEDGIRLINVTGNGAIKEFLKFLSRNRHKLTLILLDTDANNSSTAKLTEEILSKSGFDDRFISDHVLYVGEQEFEDAFSDEAIVRCLRATWPKRDGTEWLTDEIASLRNDGKFSNNLKKIVWEQCDENAPKWSKPDFGMQLAEQCSVQDIPHVVRQLFDKARQIAGINAT